MGKRKGGHDSKHKQALGEQLEDPNSHGVRTTPRSQKRRRRQEHEGGGEEEGGEGEGAAMPARTSAAILRQAREQQREVDAEEAAEAAAGADGDRTVAALTAGALAAAMAQLADSDDDSDADVGGGGGRGRGARGAAEGFGFGGGSDGGGADSDGGGARWRGDDGDSWAPDDEPDVSPEEEAALAAFMAPRGGEGGGEALPPRQRTLGDVVLERLREAQAGAGVAVLAAPGEEPVPEGLDERVVEVYQGVGQLLSRYTTGQIPKAFKIIPNLRNWEEVLYLTRPEAWSPAAVAAATSIFVSNLNARLAQRFLALVLLPRVRSDVAAHRRLHFALFQALRKATYKPGAFFKGILLPLCASRTCTLREAVIFSSVLKRSSLPSLHASAALLRLAQMDYCGTTSFFIRVLLDKKYALPFRVVDALAQHFLRFADDPRVLPVVWHQCLLCFVQRYKSVLRGTDRDALHALCSRQHHYQVTPEVLRELEQATGREGRGAAAAAAAAGVGPAAALAAAAPPLFGGKPAGAVAAGTSVEDVRALAPVPMVDDDY